MATDKVMINRAPVLTLWAAVVAERLGFDTDAALSLGKVLAGLNAQAKGQRLGIYSPTKSSREELEKHRESRTDFQVDLCGRNVPATFTPDGIRGVTKNEPVNPRGVWRYLQGKFRDDLETVQEAMRELAEAYPPEELADRAYGLYERFRPDIPAGKQGWGAAGELDLDMLREMAEEGKRSDGR